MSPSKTAEAHLIFKDTLRRLAELASAKDATLGARGELAQRLTAIRGERNGLAMKPTARADVENMIIKWVDDSAAEFRREMVERVMPFVRDARALENPRLIGAYISLVGGDDAPRAGLDRALCAAVGPELTAAMLESLAHVEWPEGGVTLEERAKRIAVLNEQERAVTAELEQVEAALREAGIFF